MGHRWRRKSALGTAKHGVVSSRHQGQTATVCGCLLVLLALALAAWQGPTLLVLALPAAIPFLAAIAQRKTQSLSKTTTMAGTRHPAASTHGMGLPSAINQPVPPPPPPLPPHQPHRVGLPGETPVAKDPAAEAHAYLKAYGPSLLGEAMQRILDVAFALATTPEVDAKTRASFAAINQASAATMILLILLQSGRITCKSAHGKLTDSDIIFLFHTARPLLMLAELGGEPPALSASTETKRIYLEELLKEEEGEISFTATSMAALEGFRALAMYDQLNGCPMSSSSALTGRMQRALVKYLHLLVDCDGKITDKERNCIDFMKQCSTELIQEGATFARHYLPAARRLKLSPYGRPEVVIEHYRNREKRNVVDKISSHQAVEHLLRELQAMTGLESVKREIDSHINTLKVSAMRQEVGLAEIKTTNHMVFTGNPGTGKTTVARKLARLYRELGILSTGTLTEVDQSALVAGYVGQTAIKTKEVIEKAKGGVLFIDEAYALAGGKAGDSFGKEAIETLLKYMEDYRDDLIVIVAGYQQPMQNFLNSNPGLKSRFNKFIFFPDYTPQDLKTIFIGICHESGYTISEALDEFLTNAFTTMIQAKPPHFGNGRTVRNLFDCVVVRQANRLVQIQEPTHTQLMELTPNDIAEEDIRKVLQ